MGDFMSRSVLITNATIADGKCWRPGEVYSGSDSEALVRMGKAEWVADSTPEPAFVAPEVEPEAEPEAGPEVAKPKKRGRPKGKK
jgi:hypothetical protein